MLFEIILAANYLDIKSLLLVLTLIDYILIGLIDPLPAMLAVRLLQI